MDRPFNGKSEDLASIDQWLTTERIRSFHRSTTKLDPWIDRFTANQQIRLRDGPIKGVVRFSLLGSFFNLIFYLVRLTAKKKRINDGER